jgi:hypothetical protein
MDNIDITDTTFSLDVQDISQFMGGGDGSVSDYTVYIYIGAAILVVIIGMFIFKFYQNKKREQTGDDCSGWFCTMNDPPRDI